MPKKNLDIFLTNAAGIVSKTTYAQAISTILQNSVPPQYANDGAKKDLAGQLAERLEKGGDIDFTPEEIVLLKEWVASGALPLAVTQIYRILNA